MHGLTRREHPRTFAAHPMHEGFVFRDSQTSQHRDPSSYVSPATPDTHPHATTKPLVEFCEERLDGNQSEVADPAVEVAANFGTPLSKRNSSGASRDLTNSRPELVDVLPGNANLAAVTGKYEAQKLDAVGPADAALLSIDNKLEFSRLGQGHRDSSARSSMPSSYWTDQQPVPSESLMSCSGLASPWPPTPIAPTGVSSEDPDRRPRHKGGRPEDRRMNGSRSWMVLSCSELFSPSRSHWRREIGTTTTADFHRTRQSVTQCRPDC